jgi:hypothetical protein
MVGLPMDADPVSKGGTTGTERTLTLGHETGFFVPCRQGSHNRSNWYLDGSGWRSFFSAALLGCRFRD